MGKQSTVSTAKKKADALRLTKVNQAAFLEAFAVTGVITYAARAAGVDRSTVYHWRDADDAFAKRFYDAIEDSTELLETTAFKRATQKEMPSDTLLIFLLKARRPERYREIREVRQQVSGTISHTHTTLDGTAALLAEVAGAQAQANLVDAEFSDLQPEGEKPRGEGEKK